DIQVGPDGGIYVADMYEQRIDHASHYQGRIHKESGRIYRIRGKDPLARSASEGKRFDLTKESSQQLLARLSDRNKWLRQVARRELLVRGQPFDVATITGGQLGLEQLWARNMASPLTDGDQ